MEKNMDTDGLEDFLKKSFEQYSESPPDDVWAGIEAGLPVATTPMVGIKTHFVRTKWAWAAAASVAALFVCQYFWMNDKVQDLSGRLEEQSARVEQLEASLQEAVATLEQAQERWEQEAAGLEAQKLPGQVAGQDNNLRERQSISEGPVAEFDNTSGKRFSEKRGNTPSPQDEQTPHSHLNNTVTPANPAAQTTGNAVTAGGNTPASEEGKMPQMEAAPSDVATEPDAGPLPYPMPFPAQGWVSGGQAPVVLYLRSDVEPVKAESSVAMGMNFLAMKTEESVSSIEPGHHTPHQARTTEMSGQTLSTELFLKKHLGNGFYLSSGLGYRQNKASGSHTQFLKFGNRHGGGHGGGGGSHDHQHEFDYELVTPVGVVDLRVEAEQTDPNEDIDENEELEINIQTTKCIEYFTIPLLVEKQFGKGRLRLTMGGGLVAGLLAKHSFDLTGLEIRNDKFKPRRDRASMASQTSLSNVVFDWRASAGLELSLTPRLNLSLTPVVSGALGNRHNNSFIQSSEFSAGLSAGASFVF